MITVHYIGDSTVQRNNIHTYPQTGMGQTLELYLREDVRVVSYAKNGRSTKSFLDEGRFAPVKAAMQPGDFLFVQFGHNDEKDDPLRHTDAFGSFQDNLRLFIASAREKGAKTVLLTPIARRQFDGFGKFLPGSHGDYPEAVRQVGKEESVPVIDLTAATEAFLECLGDEPSKPLFVWPKDNTHLKYEGAVKFCGFLAQALEELGGSYAALLAQPESADSQAKNGL